MTDPTTVTQGVVNSPAAPAPAATPTPAQLMGDKAFAVRLLNKDAAAVAQWENAHKVAAGATPSPTGAVEKLAALKADPAFGAKLAAGDVEAKALWDAAHQAAYPEAGAAPLDAAAANAAAGLPADDAAHAELAAQYAMPPLADNNGYGPEAQAFDKLSRSAMATAGFTRESGSFVAQEINRVHAHYSKLDDGGKASYALTQEAMLRGIWKENFEPNRKLVLQLVQELDRKHEGVMAVLHDSGAANSAMVLDQLYHRALQIARARNVDLTRFK